MTANRTVTLSLTILLTGATTLQGLAGAPSADTADRPAVEVHSALPASHPADVRPEPASSPPAPVEGSASQQAREAWALDRFREAGLDLPDLEIIRHSHREDCDGIPAFFARQGQDWSIELCTPAPFILLHELGHAWVAHNLTDAEREAFQQARGLPSWNDPATPHKDRATEHAADVIAWGLSDDAPSLTTDPEASFDELTRAFRTLTGVEPLVERAPMAAAS